MGGSGLPSPLSLQLCAVSAVGQGNLVGFIFPAPAPVCRHFCRATSILPCAPGEDNLHKFSLIALSEETECSPAALPLHRCEVALGEFLKEIKKNPSSVKFAEMANILVIHCQAAGECTGPASSTSLLVCGAHSRIQIRSFPAGCSPVQLLAFFCHCA